ncbi:putative reverse transcriptase domain-containing protein, partial [Tanacetum coccineum]
SFKTFQSCNPKEYDGKGGALALTHWIEKMENVIDNSGCAENQKNHKMVGANHAAYTDRFHELAKLVPHLGHGSFDVIVGMDWLSQHKAVIVCHEKVVEIPMKDGRILRVHGERAVGITKALKSAKEDEPRLSDISMVCEFEDVFPEDLSGLPP